MKRRKKGKVRRLLAACMALVIVFALLPLTAFAADIPFTVILDPSILGQTITVTMTNQTTAQLPQTLTVASGQNAEFTTGIDESSEYILTVTGMTNYEDFTSSANIVPSPPTDSYTVDSNAGLTPRTPISPFTVTVASSNTGGTATLTDTADSTYTTFVPLSNGAAVFEDFVLDGRSYTLDLENMARYEDFTGTIAAVSPTDSHTVNIGGVGGLVERQMFLPTFTVTITGISTGGTATLTDEFDQSYSTFESLSNGVAVFSASVYEGRDYLLSLTDMPGYDDVVDIQIPASSDDFYNVAPTLLVPSIKVSGLEKTPTPSPPPPDDWTNGDVTVRGTAIDNAVVGKVLSVRYSTKLSDYYADTYSSTSMPEADLDDDTGVPSTTFEFKIENPATSVGDVYVWAYGAAEEKALLTNIDSIDVRIDVKKPEITGFKIEQAAGGTQGINFLTFGTFFNEPVKITVTAEDNPELVDSVNVAASGVEEITLYYKDSGGTTNSMTEPADNSGAAVFTLPPPPGGPNGELYQIWAKAWDKAGNDSLQKGPYDFAASNGVQDTGDNIMLENEPPDIDVSIQPATYTDAIGDWYPGSNIPFTVNVQDADSGLNSVKISVNGSTPLLVDATFPGRTTALTPYSLNINSASIIIEGENTIDVTVTDNAGNTSTSSARVWIDTALPGVTNFELAAKNASSPMDPLSFLSYGTFFNDKVIVTVTADDAGGSGIKSITLYTGGNPFLTSTSIAPNGAATFELPTSAIYEGGVLFDDTLTATALDNVGYATSAQVSPVTVNSQILSNRLMIETAKPTISVTVPAPVYTDGSGGYWYDAPTAFDVDVQDVGSGIRSVAISLNGQTIATDYTGKAVGTPFYQSQTFAEPFTVHTDQGVRAADGSFSLTVKAVDNAGNITETTRVIYIDLSAPVISDFTFSAADGAQDVNGQDLSVQQTDYGYYFKDETRVTITAQDGAPTCGVQSITYYTVDITGGKSTETTVSTAGSITFVMPANFKGQVFAKATDNVGNTPGGFTSPNSVIVESPDTHLEETHIRFQQPDSPYTDNDGLALYAGDTTVGLTVTDTFSGLRRVEWSVAAPYDTSRNFSRSIDISGSQGLAGDTSGWSITKTQSNLVTEMTGTVTATNNSNAITLWVRITDRAGNTSEDFITFSIDKTAPTISVTYDNNSQDRDFPNFYKADRVATIVVTERNFRPGDVLVSITNTDGVIPAVSGWTTAWNAANPDRTTHTATVRYSADGDYTFNIRYSDNAENAAAPFGQHSFTIDKTLPRITVTYDNNQPVGGMYYPVSRTATITITEHNFETGRVRITGTATDDGAAAAFPAASSWSTRGDVHTATITYTTDARYTFTIAYTDKAGNQAAAFETQQFVVDQTAPTLEITGVADKSANNGDVIPVILFSDTNYDQDTVSISLSGANRGAVPLIGGFTGQHNGQVYTFDNFEREKEIDDIYTLSASLTDLAGNETSQIITFSVNRFGSVYVFDAALQEIEGHYVRSEVDVVVTETNVDTLRSDTINVKMTYNGVPHDLTEGTDYTVAHTGGNGTWSQYEYRIPKAMFEGEGSYVVTLYSVDEAGNVNENIQESKKAEIAFGIDKTPPIIVPIGLESGLQYPVDNLAVAVSVTDNLVLKGVRIYLNGEEIGTPDAPDQEFVVPASNSKQNLRIVAFDAAGNESTLEITDFLVTTSLFYRWYNNTPLFIGSLAAAAGLVVLAVFLIRKMRARAIT